MTLLSLLALLVCPLLARGDPEPTLNHCCSLGVNWAKEDLRCSNFTTPVAGIAPEQLSICLPALEICCLRTHRERQCELGKIAARADRDCMISSASGGEFQKDCCEACKLGVITATMSMDCNFHSFKFGSPWDSAYLSCCLGTSVPPPPLPVIPVINTQPTLKTHPGPVPPPITENLCDLYPGELCTDICISTPGSYVCACRDGFSLMSDGKSCEQEKIPNRCKVTNPCSQRCLDTGVAIECACNPGYQLGRDNRSCDDIDECETRISMCEYNGFLCRNEIGTYSCVTGDGVTVKPSQLAQFAQAGNLPPINHASKNEVEPAKCPNGYQLNHTSKFCDDIDECSLHIDNCPSNSTCKNLVGTFMCAEKSEDACLPGFQYNDATESCIDIDECSEELDTCRAKKQFCINTEGSYVCQGKLPPRQCPAGYKYNATLRNCEDVDECAENIHSCHAAVEVCRNTVGAYECDVPCDPGFQYNTTESICVDIDECATSSPCPDNNTWCFNTVGGYECHPAAPQRLPHSTHTYPQAPPLPPLPERPPILPPTVPPTTTSTQSPCPANYRSSISPNGATLCVDINECLEQKHVCNSDSEFCINEPGGYRCVQRATTTSTTVPPPSPPTTVPARVIQCEPGFEFISREQRCVDIDECNRDDDNPCDSYQSCENTIGSYICGCKTGFEQDPETLACIDVNECQANSHDCHPSQRCDNTIGSFQCIRFTSCGTGYTLNANTGYCEDDDECALKTDNCRVLGPQFVCKNTLGSFRCQRKRCEDNKRLTSTGECVSQDCPTGFQANSQGKCIDINECERGNPCRSHQRCVNKVGTYNCVSLLECGRGYEINSQGTQCVDVDECAQGTHQCPPGQQCLNRPGSYVCQCLPGYSINNAKQCVDIDECALFRDKLQVCSSNSECHNVPGSYRCICKEGFKHDQDDKVCSDIDECSVTPGLCQHNCMNIWGSYRCACNSGFVLQSDNRSCRDIDECEEFKDRNLCVGICVNTPGSYSCNCPKGYRMGSDGRTCVDIDECSTGNVCRRSEEVCLNTRGSFFCNTIDCPPNYIRDREHKNRCKRALLYCREDDQECIRMPQMYSYNYITFVSNMAIPPVGYLDLFTMRGPMWQSAVVKFSLDLINTRAPPEIAKATKDFFRMRRVSHSQAIVSLVKTIEGPQQIELKLSMEMHHNGVFGGAVVAKLFIIVSEYEF